MIMKAMMSFFVVVPLLGGDERALWGGRRGMPFGGANGNALLGADQSLAVVRTTPENMFLVIHKH